VLGAPSFFLGAPPRGVPRLADPDVRLEGDAIGANQAKCLLGRLETDPQERTDPAVHRRDLDQPVPLADPAAEVVVVWVVEVVLSHAMILVERELAGDVVGAVPRGV